MSVGESDFISRLDNVIDENMDKSSFSIDFLCSELGVSRTNLHRKIKNDSSLSTSLYVRRRRMIKAKELIESTDLNFSEIAYATGVNNPQNFSKYFNEEFNLSPTEYRQTYLEKDQNTTPSPTSEILEEKGIKTEKKNYSVLILLGIIAIAGIIGWGLYLHSNTEAPETDTSRDKSIAVLPFSSLNEEGRTFFSRGITEDILTNIAQLPGLKVISRTSSMQYRDTNKQLKEIASELGVNYILEGSVREIDNRVKITVQLIRADNDTHIWAQDYNREVEDIFKIQSEVSQEIAIALEQNISNDLVQQFDTPPTENLEAYNAFIIGRELIHSRTDDGIRSGLEKMEEAISYDPNFADAWAFKAIAYNLLGNLHYEDRSVIYQNSEEAALTALSHDPKCVPAHLALASIYNDRYKWQESIDAFETVMELSPNNALAHYWYSLVLRELGEHSKSVIHSKIAADLDPLLPVITAGHIKNCAIVEDFEQADFYLNKARLLHSNSFLYVLAEGLLYEHKQEYEIALSKFEEAIRMNPEAKSMHRAKYYVLGKLGRKEEIDEYLDNFKIESGRDLIILSTIYCGLGDESNCLKYIKQGADENTLPDDVFTDPRYDVIRNNEEFVAIMKEYGFYDTYRIN